jgi:hypothetical protein
LGPAKTSREMLPCVNQGPLGDVPMHRMTNVYGGA